MGTRDLEIARAVKLRPVEQVAETLGLDPDDLEPYGTYKAKVRWKAIERSRVRPDGALVLVTAMTPTPAGEGKSTIAIGLADGLRKLGSRSIVGLGGPAHGVPRESGFEITEASELMAILCLATDLRDFKARAERVVVGATAGGDLVSAGQLHAAGAMAALVREALKPNLVQTLEGTPALVHGGPFGNIAHGCSSLIATRLGLKLAEVVVTEAGFATDLGAEKFVDIKCRTGGLAPACAVVVATVRAVKVHGLENLAKHVQNVRRFGLAPVVALNRFATDPDAEVAAILEACRALGARAEEGRAWELGGAGATGLAQAVLDAVRSAAAAAFRYLYQGDWTLEKKIETIATEIYGADGVLLMPAAATKLEHWQAAGYGRLAVCIAKTQNSLSDDAKKPGRPRGFTVTVRDAKLAAGAGFVIAYTGDILTMPGLPRVPGAESIDIDLDGNIVGLF